MSKLDHLEARMRVEFGPVAEVVLAAARRYAADSGTALDCLLDRMLRMGAASLDAFVENHAHEAMPSNARTPRN